VLHEVPCRAQFVVSFHIAFVSVNNQVSYCKGTTFCTLFNKKKS
jgi:hypothetical protein